MERARQGRRIPSGIGRREARLPLSSLALAVESIAVMGLGLYFGVLRPPLLPEDLRYLNSSLAQIAMVAPAMTAWLGHVFWVLGGYIFATGVVTLYVALTTFRARARGAAVVVAVAGAASVGSMALVNVLIASDFKWPLLLLALLWALALALYLFEGSAKTPAA
ncbi:hypothetical protein BH11GEM1_BH11GEM1_35400 [soil metagenome]